MYYPKNISLSDEKTLKKKLSGYTLNKGSFVITEVKLSILKHHKDRKDKYFSNTETKAQPRSDPTVDSQQ